MSPRVRRILELSTAHLPEQILNQPGGLNASDGVVGYEDEYGAWLWVPDSTWRHQGPPELERLWRYAREHSCDYIRLDADADIDPQLPVYEW